VGIDWEIEPLIVERLAIAFVLGLAGFFAGMFVWWALDDIPGLNFSFSAYLAISIVLGIVAFFIGLFRGEQGAKPVGDVWDLLNRIHSSVFRWFRIFRS
jgi:hypothetical protein